MPLTPDEKTAVEFLDRYYREEIQRLCVSDRDVLQVDYSDLYAFDTDLAERVTGEYPRKTLTTLQEALSHTDASADTDLSDCHVAVVNLGEPHTHKPTELRHEHGGRYIGVRGKLDRVTFPKDHPTELAYQCQRCGTMTHLPVTPEGEMSEPHECQGCERQGPFRVNHEHSEWEDICQFRITVPPSDRDSDGSVDLEGVATGPICDLGDGGLTGSAGDEVIAYGVLRREVDNEDRAIFSRWFELLGIEFPSDEENSVDIDAHKDEFTELAGRPDAVDLFAESISPDLYATEEWQAAFQLGVAYLFGAPRIDVDSGPTYRGDIHALIVSDFGMGKSSFTSSLADYAPNCIRKSATALASDVGLTAAAVKDEFGGGQWAIEPGLLVKASGGHLILDEIDKGPEQLSQMNDAIEGEQIVDVEKAGQSRTFKSRTSVMATGNPVDGRFDPNQSIASQLDIDGSTLSRFDGIITMRDSPDEDEDKAVAETITAGFREAMELQHGERESFDVLERVVSPAVGRAWVAHARENVAPSLPADLERHIQDWYATELRQLNHRFGEGDGEDMPAPVTARVVETTIRYAVAFARCRLNSTVSEQNVERAKELTKLLVKQNWNGTEFDATRETGANASQNARKQAIERVISDEQRTPAEIAEETGLDERTVERELESMKEAGDAYEPRRDVYKGVD